MGNEIWYPGQHAIGFVQATSPSAWVVTSGVCLPKGGNVARPKRSRKTLSPRLRFTANWRPFSPGESAEPLQPPEKANASLNSSKWRYEESSSMAMGPTKGAATSRVDC